MLLAAMVMAMATGQLQMLGDIMQEDMDNKVALGGKFQQEVEEALMVKVKDTIHTNDDTYTHPLSLVDLKIFCCK